MTVGGSSNPKTNWATVWGFLGASSCASDVPTDRVQRNAVRAKARNLLTLVQLSPLAICSGSHVRER